MYYGDGDGQRFRDLTYSFDVVAHEFTHGVTDFESNLLYQKESGALNEALSDIFGVAADTFRRGGVINAATWKMGEASFTPRISGDALRYMNDPEKDGISRSYYPERHFPGACTPSQDNDRCGVHINSGIANLAFYLMVQGGRHPRGKTSVNVPAIGMAKAERIFYRAQTSCLTAGSNFRAARNCTAQAAQDLYGAAARAAVLKAWNAVGVSGGSGGGGGAQLANGVARTGLRGAAGSMTYFYINVPAGATNLTFRLSGGSGDADLYVRRGSRPTTSTYACRSWSSGTSESCSFASPQVGTYHVLVHGHQAYSGVRLVASFSTSSGACRGNGEAANLSASSGQQLFYTFEVAACASKVIFTLSGGSGDADLYVRRGTRPSITTYDCRSNSANSSERCVVQRARAGTYHTELF